MKPDYKAYFEKGMSYTAYRQLVLDNFAQGKSTAAVDSEALVHYSELNIARMNRWDKHFKLDEAQRESLRQIKGKQHWLVLTEGWCGDAAHALPIMHALASHSDAVELKVLLRDEHIALMDEHLTKGARGIPKLLILDADFNFIDSWGPRPASALQIFESGKAKGTDPAEVKRELQLWYSRNKGIEISSELIELALKVVSTPSN